VTAAAAASGVNSLRRNVRARCRQGRGAGHPKTPGSESSEPGVGVASPPGFDPDLRDSKLPPTRPPRSTRGIRPSPPEPEPAHLAPGRPPRSTPFVGKSVSKIRAYYGRVSCSRSDNFKRGFSPDVGSGMNMTAGAEPRTLTRSMSTSTLPRRAMADFFAPVTLMSVTV
jgi:hypothetical protein